MFGQAFGHVSNATVIKDVHAGRNQTSRLFEILGWYEHHLQWSKTCDLHDRFEASSAEPSIEVGGTTVFLEGYVALVGQ